MDRQKIDRSELDHSGLDQKVADQADSDQTHPGEWPFLFAKGFCMGSADVVPGVSGGTMALILGIYTRLIFAIKSVDMDVLRSALTLQWRTVFDRIHWLFLTAVLAGIAAAILFFTKIVALPVLMHTHPEIIYGLFFGLIAGSIVLLLGAIGKFGWKELLFVLIGVAIGFRIVTLVPAATPETSLFVFLSGSLAITAMVLPGISGSFILLILQKYEYILGHVALLGTEQTLEAIAVLIPFGLGMLAGIVLFVRVLSWLLKRYHIITVCLLIGFMAGSLYVIWPYQDRTYHEVVETLVMPVNDPEVVDLLESEPDRNRPEYRETGELINPAAPVDEQLVEVRKVRRKLVASHPFLPDRRQASSDPRLQQGVVSLFGGLAMMIAGFILVGAMGWFMKKNHPGVK